MQEIRVIEIEAEAGEHIRTVILKALQNANENTNIKFNFNGIEILVTYNDSLHSVEEQFNKKLEENHKAYLESKQYKDYQEQRKVEIVEKNVKLAEMCNKLKEGIVVQDLVKLVGEFCQIADDSGCNKKYSKQLVDFLEYIGFKSSDCVGSPLVNTDETIFLRWLFGQVISTAKECGSPHPIASKFCEDYFKLFVEGKK